MAEQSEALVVGNDRGGPVAQRADEIARLRAYRIRVEIRGNICYSACTMYLGAGDVCVSPSTSFGFHGPSAWGQPLDPDQFEHWSRVMARFYNEPLRQWFMSDARYRQANLYRVSGSEIINLGYASC
jgi:hypothetical protein